MNALFVLHILLKQDGLTPPPPRGRKTQQVLERRENSVFYSVPYTIGIYFYKSPSKAQASFCFVRNSHYSTYAPIVYLSLVGKGSLL
jgi:hypothetical protein